MAAKRIASFLSQVIGLVLLILCTAGPSSWLHTAARTAPRTTVGWLFFAAATAAWPRSRRALQAFWQRLEWVPAPQFRRVLVLLAFVGYAALALGMFHGVPRIDDGVAAVFQARLFARGRLTLPLPPHPEFFELFGLIGAREGLPHRCGMYPPGWPALLVPGVLLGAPWLVNPVLGALLIAAIMALAREAYDERTARVAGLLALPSPFIAIPAALHLSHTATQLTLTLSFICVLRLRRTGATKWGVLAGVCWGVAFLCRPVDALVLGTVQALVLLFPWQRPIRWWKGALAGAAVAGLAVAGLAAFQSATTGHWRLSGHEVKMGAAAHFGFRQLSRVTVHTPQRGWQHTQLRLRALNENLLGWPLPNLWFPLLPFLAGRARLREMGFLLPLPALTLLFMTFWYYEICFPARYLSAATPGLFVLSAAGLSALAPLRIRGRGWGTAGVILLAGWGLFFLSVSWPHHAQTYGVDYYDVENILPRVLRDYEIRNAVVFMDAIGRGPVRGNEMNDYYATGFLRNDLDLQGDVVFARNARARNHELARTYPGRAYYLYRYDRHHRKALLYRMTFDEEGRMALDPVPPRTPHLLPPPPATTP